MTQTPLNVAIIGMGKWGQTLVNSVQGLSESIRFVAGATRTVSKAAAFAERQGIEILPDLAAVLARDDIQGVVLATPHSQHREQIEAAAAAGKHIFSEKPLTLTGPDAVAAYAAAEKAGVVLALGHNRRFLPAYAKFSHLVREEIGSLRQLIGNFSSGVAGYAADSWRSDPAESPAGGMTGLGIHVVDAMIGLGLQASEVTVVNRRKADHGMADTVTALIETVDGPVAVLTTVAGPGRYWRIEAFGSNGWATMNGEHSVTFGRAGAPEQIWNFAWTDMERAELEAFADAVSGTAPYPIDAEQGVRGVRLFEAICRAALDAPGGRASREVAQG
ncbi:gfo/Idh/MocA family oxidoreductase [Pseudooceanicola sp. 216_PA32_1]|uniref:Gfo/Idh/MocA family oxidoreductase n=1 Tax=Pseudooceanicola pacificus TaxID=2676438 RepID=A0A844WC18_9RHOB|nr:Gfo/Idh/MocA family oxidoreductase [Pseudooceanicola pacificus]MWB77642.1 gfo/Idh/MocA family oxidoreductase [Pseudooceanicola pacificus]